MDVQLKKGINDYCVLSVIMKGESYGYKILEDLREIVELSQSTLYPILKRLTDNGFLETRTEESNGRLRKYYKITRSGEEKFCCLKKDVSEIQRIIGAIDKSGKFV